MKPQPPFAGPKRTRFSLVDFCFQSDLSDWRGSSWSGGGDEDSPARRFNEFSRQFLIESRRERDREMVVLLFVMVVTAWPVLYMIYSVARLLLGGKPLDL